MDTVRVHSKGFKFLFYFYHGCCLAGVLLVTGLISPVLPDDYDALVGFLMIVTPFFLAPPELIILFRERKVVFRRGLSSITLYFEDIAQIVGLAGCVEIKGRGGRTLLNISDVHFKKMNFFELAEYLEDLLSGRREVDYMKYTAVKFSGCKIIGWCKSAFRAKAP